LLAETLFLKLGNIICINNYMVRLFKHPCEKWKLLYYDFFNWVYNAP